MMKKTLLIALVTVLAAAFAASAFAEEGAEKNEPTETGRRYAKAEALHDEGKLKEAVALYREVIEELEESGSDGEASAARSSLAMALAKLGEHEEAEVAFKKALDYYKKKYPEGHPYTAAILNNLAGVQKLRGDRDGAERSFVEALEIFKKTFGIHHPYTKQAKKNLVLFRGGSIDDIDDTDTPTGHP